MYCINLYFRWIKFEEDVEEEGERWSKPHVATLSLHSLFELRKGILSGSVLLDMEATNIGEISGMSPKNYILLALILPLTLACPRQGVDDPPRFTLHDPTGLYMGC